MDSEKNTHMRELVEAGRPVTDKGPFFHHAKWESYKSGIEGKLGGGMLGAGMGAVTGCLAVAGIALATAALPAMPLLIVGGFSAAGLLYGVHEFGEVGKIAGAVAASDKLQEKRIKPFIEANTQEVLEEIAELKALIKGEKPPEKIAKTELESLKAEQDDYRTDHFQGSKVEGLEKIFFWKVALVGLVAGVIAGAVLGYGGMTEHILHGLGAAEGAFGPMAEIAISMTAMGAIGASFGINRDIFRQIFDQTDLWFRGFVSHDHAKSVLLDPSRPKPLESLQEKAVTEASKESILLNTPIDYPASPTFHRDKLLAAGREALMNMDHTKMSPH